MNVIGYLRVSGQSQVDGDGFARQEAAIEAFCKSHNLNLLHFLEERAVSGTAEAMDRPAFSDMIQAFDANPGIVQGVIVERLDRLARDLMVQELLLKELRQRDVKLFAADQDRLDDMADAGADPTRVLIRQVLGAVSQWEKTNLVRKLRAARDRIRTATGKCEGRKLFAEKDPEQRKVLMKILDMYDAGIKYRVISRALQAFGHLTPNGKPYSISTIHAAVARFRPKSNRRARGRRKK